jgi:chemotaxis signal transduction protein
MASSAKKYILFEIAGQQWAWPLQPASQFFNIDYILPLAEVDKNIVGIAYQHGRILTVIRADKMLGDTKSNLKSKQALWFEYQQDAYALLVDAGLETVTIKTFFTDRQSKIFIHRAPLGAASKLRLARYRLGNRRR